MNAQSAAEAGPDRRRTTDDTAVPGPERGAAPPMRQRRAAPRQRWPRPLRKDPMEAVAMVLIGAGVFMMCQPFSIALFGWSFLVVLAGTILFLVVSHFPE